MPPKRRNTPAAGGGGEASNRAVAVMAAKKKEQQQQKKLQEQQAKLLRAVKAGQLGEVLRMVDSDGSVIKLPEPVDGHTDVIGWLLDQSPPPLIGAAGWDLRQVVKLLLGHLGIEVNVQDNQGVTALNIASQEGHHQVVKLLLAHSGIEVNVQDNQGATALNIASQESHHQVVKLLLAHSGIDVNVPYNQGATALYIASQNGHHQVVKLLLGHPGIEVNVPDTEGWTALHRASHNGHRQVVELLLCHPTTDATARRPGDSESESSWLRELLHSVQAKEWGKAKGLLDDPKRTTPSWTALHDAANQGHPAVIDALLRVSPGLVNEALANNGRTALHLAASLGHLDAVTKLLKHGADASLETTFSKCTPLQLAAEAGHSHVTKALLESTPRPHKRTALLGAIKEGHAGVTMVLRDAGVEVTQAAVDELPPRFVVLDFDDELGPGRCRLGKGGFGVVYKGIDCRDGNLIAEKRALTKEERYEKPHPGEDEKSQKATAALSTNLEREFHLHESLRHRNIVPVYRKRLGDDGYWRIHMRLMNGQTVEAKAEGSGLRDEAHVRRYLSDALWGLNYLHSKQVCHFDIKPGNMLLDDNDRLMLSDFGLSREGSDKTDSPGGTRLYKAPELVKKTGKYGPGTDIWALACSVIYMATGKHPWTTSSPKLTGIQVKLKLEAQKHPPLRNNGVLLPGISPSLEDLLEKVFHPDQKERFSAERCLLHPFVSGTPFTAAPSGQVIEPRDQQPPVKSVVAATAGGGGRDDDDDNMAHCFESSSSEQQARVEPQGGATAGAGGMALSSFGSSSD